ncbi:hypothetical protein OAO01_04530 [Oligoflexia bacterium]|nr:hypothetical protein [Oligoflexia bacterium]
MSKPNTALFVKATLSMYLDCIKKASLSLYKNWLIIFASVIAYLAFVYSFRLFAPLGVGGGFLAGLVHIALLSIYYSWISDIVKKEDLTLKKLIVLDYSMFFNVISVAFILFIAKYLVSAVVESSGAPWIGELFQFGIVIIFNAIPEVIYLHRYESIPALGHAATFTRENWIEWFLPLVIILSPLLILNPNFVLKLIAQSSELLPALMIAHGWKILAAFHEDFIAIGLTLIGILLGNWIMLFRANLFLELESGTRRKRMYNAKQ